MRHIEKGKTPRQLDQWIRSTVMKDGRHINCDYDSLPSTIKDLIKEYLLDEQGWLCCYTGRAISDKTSHIEHFKPQTLCRAENNHEDVDYQNLLAAFPGRNIQNCSFGAHAKKEWFDVDLLISPLKRNCSKRFKFDQLGRMQPAQNDDDAARETLVHLNLHDESLTEMRRVAIEEALFPDAKVLSEANLRKIASQGFCHRNTKRQFAQFCFVIEQVANDVLHKSEQDRKRRQAIHNQSKRK